MILVLLDCFHVYLRGLEVIKQIEIDHHVLLLIGIVIEICQLWILDDFDSSFSNFSWKCFGSTKSISSRLTQ